MKRRHFINQNSKRSKRPLSSGIFGVLGIIFLIYCAGIALAGFGTYFFLIWGLLGITSLALSAALCSQKLMAVIPKWLKVVCCVLFAMGLTFFFVVEGLILSQYNAKPQPDADFCIVLGAQWKADGPSEVLRKRLDTAIAYLSENPDTSVIVSGAQGSDEPISEAEGMKEYLLDAGIATERILMEDNSFNTYQNLMFSSQFLDSENDRVVIVTNNFHVFRALSIAKKQGYAHVEGLAANSTAGMGPNNLFREFFGVIKDFIKGNL